VSPRGEWRHKGHACEAHPFAASSAPLTEEVGGTEKNAFAPFGIDRFGNALGRKVMLLECVGAREPSGSAKKGKVPPSQPRPALARMLPFEKRSRSRRGRKRFASGNSTFQRRGEKGKIGARLRGGGGEKLRGSFPWLHCRGATPAVSRKARTYTNRRSLSLSHWPRYRRRTHAMRCRQEGVVAYFQRGSRCASKKRERRAAGDFRRGFYLEDKPAE